MEKYEEMIEFMQKELLELRKLKSKQEDQTAFEDKVLHELEQIHTSIVEIKKAIL
jgi:hypothetical protein